MNRLGRRNLYAAASDQTEDQQYQKDDQEQAKQETCDSNGARSDAGKPEQRGNTCHKEEDKRPSQ